MIISDDKANEKLNNPMNLINRLHNTSNRQGAMNLFGVGRSNVKEAAPTTPIPTAPPTASFNPFLRTETQLIPSNTSVATALTEAPQIEDLLDNSETKIKLAHAHDNALQLLNRSVDELSLRLEEVKADKLPSVISAASKVVEGIRRERNEANKNSKGQDVHYHFYTPTQKKVTEYQVIDV